MSLKEHFLPISKQRFFDELIDEIEKYGFGSMLKSDQDALLYHLIAKHITPGVVRDRHGWVEILRVKPGRLNGVQETASVKFNKIEDTTANWLIVLRQLSAHPPEVQDISSGKVVVYIDDAHLYRFLEWYLNNQGSSPEYQLNRTQLVLKYHSYLSLLEKIHINIGLETKHLESRLKEDKSSKKMLKAYKDVGHLFHDLKEKTSETTITESTKELLKYVSFLVIGLV